MPGVKVLNRTCKICGHQWQARVTRPAKCPACQSVFWQVGKEGKVREQRSHGAVRDALDGAETS